MISHWLCTWASTSYMPVDPETRLDLSGKLSILKPLYLGDMLFVEIFSGSRRLAHVVQAAQLTTGPEWHIVHCEIYTVLIPRKSRTLCRLLISGHTLVAWVATECKTFSTACRVDECALRPLRDQSDITEPDEWCSDAEGSKMRRGNTLADVRARCV